MTKIPTSIDETAALLKSNGYVAGRDLATVVFLALKMERPLFLEGEAGVGKTEVAKVLAEGLGRKLIRLQCYEGLDINSAVYEWNYAAQMIEIRLAEASGELDCYFCCCCNRFNVVSLAIRANSCNNIE